MSGEVHVERLQAYTPEDAAGIGRLMPFLTKRLSDEPVSEDLLRTIIESPLHEQLVARIDARIVGAATMNIIMGPAAGKQAWLNDFVTDPETKGVGSLIWDEMAHWCHDNGINLLNFTSKKDRLTAHLFYEYRGADVRDTNVYRKDFSGDR